MIISTRNNITQIKKYCYCIKYIFFYSEIQLSKIEV